MGNRYFRIFGSISLGLAIACLSPSCELINPDEKIPSFIHIDSLSLSTTGAQGSNDHHLLDAWVYENENLLGAYELPAEIPVLQEGSNSIRIRPGIKVSGQVGTRSINPFMTDFLGDVTLYPDSHVTINPTFSYRSWVTFDWIEGFDNAGISLATTAVSEGSISRINGPESFEGQTAFLHLETGEDRFECKTDAGFELPGGGAPVMLEFTYKCNNSVVVGLFSRYPSGTFQTPILVLNPSDDWNRIYLSLTDIISSNTSFIDHEVFFGFLRDDGVEGEINVYLDNIKLIH